MVSWDQDQVNAYNARLLSKPMASTGGVAVESELHDSIIDECNRRGWLYVHGRMDVRSTITKGAPDFIIYADGGKMLHVECKRADGKQSMDQLKFEAHARKLGHTIFIVHSMDEFLAACATVRGNTV